MPALPPLRFVTCGSVDDGKSTLIGRLLYDSRHILEDQAKALESDSRQYGTQGNDLDLALLVDGLQAEREQGITIDVAYRYFSTEARRYTVADTPGHEQYTRNMATGASTADLAILLVDARKGLLVQTRRHARIAAMMGIRHVVLAVNKMDLIGFNLVVYDRIVSSFRPLSEELSFTSLQAIPISALCGDNVFTRSPRTPWYCGPTLGEHLDRVEVAQRAMGAPFRMPVQWVHRPDPHFRGFMGRVAQGSVREGDKIRVAPSGATTHVREILVGDRRATQAEAGESITLLLADEVDISRGDVLAAAAAPPQVADQFEARLLWLSERPLMAGRPYLVKLHTREIGGSVTSIKHRLDVNTGQTLAAKSLELNDVGLVNLGLHEPVVFEPYGTSRALGGFILIDRYSGETAGAGMIDFALRRASNIHWQVLEVGKEARAKLMRQPPTCIWFTGLSGSGKSTIASLLEKRLHAEGRHTFILDGDNIRHGLNRDLGFTEADRVENIRRIAEVAKLMTDAGLIVLVSFISPFRSERQMARELFLAGEFVEVFVDASLEACEHRDPKGLYAKARRGELPNFTGIDSLYEPPEHPEVHLRSDRDTVEACVDQILQRLRCAGT